MSPNDMKETLMARTIAVIAEDGLDKTTTKAIVAGTGINEAYIYRLFSDKEHLLIQAFEKLDKELADKTMEYVCVMYIEQLDFETRCRVYFDALWKFLIEHREKCLAFVQYFYSPYFAKHSAQAHQQLFQPLVQRFRDAFIDEADVWMILNHILNVMLDFAVKVHHNQMPENDDYAEHVFRVIFVSVKQYFKDEKERVS